jgi:hypothetical protein
VHAPFVVVDQVDGGVDVLALVLFADETDVGFSSVDCEFAGLHIVEVNAEG